MGFQLNIVRSYLGEERLPITQEEWFSYVDTQTDFERQGDDVYWSGWSKDDPTPDIHLRVVFTYMEHRQGITVYPPDSETIAKVIAVATDFNAMALGDEDEHFMPDGRILINEDGNHADVNYFWNEEEFWEIPESEPDRWWTPLSNWWWRFMVAWRTRNI